LESLYQVGKPLSGLVGPTANMWVGGAVVTVAPAKPWTTKKLVRAVAATATAATALRRGDPRNNFTARM
jgi:hypothetical protein